MSRQLRLMPDSAVRRQAKAESFAIWWRVVLVAAIGCSALAAWEVWQTQSSTQQRVALEAQHAPIKQLRTDIKVLKARIESLTNNEQLALELANQQSTISLVGQIGQAAAYAGGDLYVESFGFTRRLGTMEQAAEHVLQLDGAARDNLAITRFAEGLRNAGLFSEVQLSSTEARVMAEQSVTAFELECVF